MQGNRIAFRAVRITCTTFCDKCLCELAIPAGFEPATVCCKEVTMKKSLCAGISAPLTLWFAASPANALPADGFNAVRTTHVIKPVRDAGGHDYSRRWWWWRHHHRQVRWDDDDRGRHWWWRHSRDERGKHHRENDHDSDSR